MKKLYLLSAIALAGFLTGQAQALDKAIYTTETTVYFAGTAYYTYDLQPVTAGGLTNYSKIVKSAKITTADIIKAIGQAQEETFSATAKLVLIDDVLYVVDGDTESLVYAGFNVDYRDQAEASTDLITATASSYNGSFLSFYGMHLNSSGFMEGRATSDIVESGPGTLQLMDVYGILAETEFAKDNAALSYCFTSSKGSVSGTFSSSGAHGVVVGVIVTVPKLVKNNPS